MRLIVAIAAGLLAPTIRPAGAAPVLAGGALDLALSGFVYFLAHGGQLAAARQDRTVSDRLQFFQRIELDLLAKSADQLTGTDYGAAVRLKTDDQRTLRTDEAWIFLSGRWGELRLGEQLGVSENSSVGAQEVAAGTGGIDGDVVDEIDVPLVYLGNTGTTAKISYYTPDLAGFSVGLSFTPTLPAGDEPAVDARAIVEGGLVYDGQFGDAAVLASVVGIAGKTTGNGASGWRGWQVGATIEWLGLELGGSFADQNLEGPASSFFTAGIGWRIGRTEVSMTYGLVLESSGGPYGRPYNLVLSADRAILPGVELAADIARFDHDGSSPGFAGDECGWQAVGRLGLAF